MNKFLLYTFLFFVPILLGGVLLEIALRAVPNGYGFKKAYLDTQKGQIETLILGSSHAYYNINPQHLDGKSFNAANPAQSLQYDMLLLKQYISNMPKLQTVILPVGYPTLFFELGHSPESWRLTHYARDFGFPISLDHFKFKFFILSKMLKWNLEDIETHFLKKEKVYKMTELGWGTDYGGNREGKIEKSAKASIFWHTAPKSSHLEANKECLIEIIQICSEKNIKLILVNPPLHKIYRERRNPDQVAISFNFVEDMITRYPNMVMLDFSEGEGFDDGDFYDGDHMNEVGAKKLSQKINQFIQE